MSVSAESTTVAGLARKLGVSFDPTTDDFWVTALANHEQRLEQGLADRPLVNRTSALWAAMALDPQVSLAVSEGHLVRQRFAVVSNIDDTARLPDRPPESPRRSAPGPSESPSSPSSPRIESPYASSEEGSQSAYLPMSESETSVASDIGLDTTLVEALTTYAAERPTSQQPLTVPEIALAVLRSASATTGLLSSRLREAGAGVPATIDALTRLVTGTGVYGFSASVRAIRTKTGAETEVSATLLLRAIYDQEPYSGAEVATALSALAGDTGAADTVDGWLRRVRELYDATQVLESKRSIIDGELTIRALTVLDPEVAEALENDPAAERWLQGIEPAPRTSSRRSTPSADEPALEDLLGRRSLAVGLVEFFNDLHSQGRSSFVMHLDARWGEGKSSVLNLLKHELQTPSEDAEPTPEPATSQTEDRPKMPEYLVVEVNAWREQQVGAQWWTLYRAMRLAEREPMDRGERIRLWMRSTRDLLEVRRHQVWPVLLTSLVVLVVGLIMIWAGSGKQLLDLRTLQSVISLALLVAAGSAAWLKFVEPTSARDARALVESDPNPMAEIRELFARTLGRQSGPTLFLVDDLDRCEPTYVVRFLETMQTLVRDVDHDGHGPYAIVAADGEWLRRSYVKHYADVFGEDRAENLGFAFLDKIFQLHVRLPDVEPRLRQDYYRRLLFGRPASDPTGLTVQGYAAEADDRLLARVRQELGRRSDLESVSDLSRPIDQIQDPTKRQDAKAEQVRRLTSRETSQARFSELARYATLQDANPRTIRLFVNAMSLQIAVRVIESRPLNLDRLALWVTLERRWPDLAAHLRLHPEDADLLVAEDQPARTPTEGAPPEQRQPEQAQQQTKVSEMTEELAALAPPEARAVMRHPRWGPLDTPAVRDCVGARADAEPAGRSTGQEASR